MITSSLEDYIEFIYNEIQNGKNLKAIDIANSFNISRASVSEALIRLSDNDLIIYEGRKGIKITQKGIMEAEKIINKHNTLSIFLTEVLGFDKEKASANACKIEHVIDEEVIKTVSEFTEFCIKNNIASQFKEKRLK